MPRNEDFTGRVNYAAQVIANGRNTSRAFDSCLENNDGAVVVTALWRRAKKNPRLAENMPRYLSMDIVRRDARSLAHIPTRKLKDVAAKMRERARTEDEARMAERKRKNEAEKQACIDAGYTVRHFPEQYRWEVYRPDGTVLSVDCTWEDNAWYVAKCDMEAT